MTNIRKKNLITWLELNFYAIKTINKRHTSYGLKHLIQNDMGAYYTNDEFKGAMLKCGYISDNKNQLNWNFNVSEKSIIRICKRIRNQNDTL